MMPHPPHSRSASFVSLLAACVALMSLFACTRTEEKPAAQAPPQQAAAFQVTRVDLGNAIGADKKVTAPATAFKPTDTIYASVMTEGAAPSVALLARWTYEDGQVVSESTQNITPTGPAVTEFHISKPDGWPAGKYTLALSANGKPAGGAQFTVTN